MTNEKCQDADKGKVAFDDAAFTNVRDCSVLKVALDASDNSDSMAHSLLTYPFGQGLIASARTRCTTLQKASVHAHKLDNALNEVSDALDAVYNIDVQDWVVDLKFSEDLAESRQRVGGRQQLVHNIEQDH